MALIRADSSNVMYICSVLLPHFTPTKMRLQQTKKYLCEHVFKCDYRWLQKKLKDLGITHKGPLSPGEIEILMAKHGTADQRAYFKTIFVPKES